MRCWPLGQQLRQRNEIKKPETIAGFCHHCHSDVHVVHTIYFCRCGHASDESYDYPPSWVFKPSEIGVALDPIEPSHNLSLHRTVPPCRPGIIELRQQRAWPESEKIPE